MMERRYPSPELRGMITRAQAQIERIAIKCTWAEYVVAAAEIAEACAHLARAKAKMVHGPYQSAGTPDPQEASE